MLENIKPSGLPNGTLIDDQEHGTWLKDSDYTWFNVAPLAGRRVGLVYDAGPSDQEKAIFSLRHNLIEMPADEFFTNFKVLSLPVTMLEYMQREMSKIIEFDCRDFDIRKALKHHLESEDICPHPNGGVPPEGCC